MRAACEMYRVVIAAQECDKRMFAAVNAAVEAASRDAAEIREARLLIGRVADWLAAHVGAMPSGYAGLLADLCNHLDRHGSVPIGPGQPMSPAGVRCTGIDHRQCDPLHCDHARPHPRRSDCWGGYICPRTGTRVRCTGPQPEASPAPECDRDHE
jgi:hypothetical protein